MNVSDHGALTLSDVRVTFGQGRNGSVLAVDAPSLAVDQGALLGISGPSGSGKTTLLHVLGGLQTPEQGRVRWGADELADMSETARDGWRRRHVGFVFQDFHLVPELTARENVLLPRLFSGWSAGAEGFARATALLAQVGVPDPDRRAAVLSRGEQQRVAIARALLAGPRLILADEPTASLDAETGEVVAELLVRSARETGATLIVVSHDPAMLARLETVRRMEKGVLLA